MVEKTTIASSRILSTTEHSPVVQWSSMIGSGPIDPGSNPGRAILIRTGSIPKGHENPKEGREPFQGLRAGSWQGYFIIKFIFISKVI